MTRKIEDGQKLATDLNMLKDRLLRQGFYRTARMLDIATQEIGWEMLDEPTPDYQKKHQLETFDPNQYVRR